MTKLKFAQNVYSVKFSSNTYLQETIGGSNRTMPIRLKAVPLQVKALRKQMARISFAVFMEFKGTTIASRVKV